MLHRAEHRGYRELALRTSLLAEHWRRLDAPAFTDGAGAARDLSAELAPLLERRGLAVRPGAEQGGRWAAALKQPRAAFLERNQARR